MTFTNAKQKLPKVFKDKIKADQEWEDYKNQKIIYVGEKMMEARNKRANVLRLRSMCIKFIKDALKS